MANHQKFSLPTIAANKKATWRTRGLLWRRGKAPKT